MVVSSRRVLAPLALLLLVIAMLVHAGSASAKNLHVEQSPVPVAVAASDVVATDDADSEDSGPPAPSCPHGPVPMHDSAFDNASRRVAAPENLSALHDALLGSGLLIEGDTREPDPDQISDGARRALGSPVVTLCVDRR